MNGGIVRMKIIEIKKGIIVGFKEEEVDEYKESLGRILRYFDAITITGKELTHGIFNLNKLSDRFDEMKFYLNEGKVES